MDHASFLVDILDNSGNIIGSKLRGDIDKSSEIYNGVFVIVKTSENELVLASIPARTDLPNLYTGLLGATAATIRRQHETSSQAATRAAKNELGLADATLAFLGEGMAELSNGKHSFISVFVASSDMPQNYSKEDVGELKKFSQYDFENIMQTSPQTIAPTLQYIWQKYSSAL